MRFLRNRLSRREFCRNLFATSLVSALVSPSCQKTVSTAATTPQWSLGIGADPFRFLWEVDTDSMVESIAHSWSPQFLSGWLNSYDHRQGDLSGWQELHRNGQLAAWFAQGYTLHVITWENDELLPTGQYHISPQYLRDLEQLATYIRRANHDQRPTYWTLATEFSYWQVPADTYNETTAPYYQALINNLRRARDVIKEILPQAWVAPSWGGWITTFDEPARGWGRSMIPPFAEFLQEMDGIAFQAMRPRRTGEADPSHNIPDPGNPAQILQCCEVFSQYHNSLMVSHYEPCIKENHPNGGRADTAASDFWLMTRPEWLSTVTKLGLDKFSLMHYGLYKGDPYGALTAAENFQKTLRQKA